MAYRFSDDAVMCRMFPSRLRDVALRWFTRLPAGQIKNFKELAEQFTVRFITNNRVIKGSKALTNLKKKNGETLREYSSRYWKTYQETDDCDLKFALNTVKYGLLNDSNGIYNSLTRVPLYTFDELISNGLDQWGAIQLQGIQTENCKTLKKFLEGLMSKRHLVEYFKRAKKANKSDDGEYEEESNKRPANRLLTCVIDAIHATKSNEALTKNAIRVQFKMAQCVSKSFLGEVMSIYSYEESRKAKEAYKLRFTEQDMQGVDTIYNDALVLTININTFDVKRILIDPRSSSEIMYHNLYKKLDLPASKV